MNGRPGKKVLRRWAIALAGAMAAYLLAGFFAVPALLSWQIQKQVAQRLDHRVTLREVRFNPLLLELEVDELAFADAQQRPMFGVGRLLVDFELRSLIDRAWTFAQVRLERPVLEIELDAEGRHNFADLMDRLRGPEPAQDGPPSRLVVQRLAVSDARIHYRDRFLAEPTVTRIADLSIDIDRLSSLDGERGRFRISGRSASDESFESSGEIGLNPFMAKGHLNLAGIQMGTLVKALSRRLDVGVARGRIDVDLDFDVATDGKAALSARADGLELKVAGLALSVRGERNPLFEVESIALEGAQADLAAREFSARSLHVLKGTVSATIDASRRVDWGRLLRRQAGERGNPAPGTDSPAPAATAPGATASATAQSSWRLSLGQVRVDEVALNFVDAVNEVAFDVAQLAFAAAPKLEFGPEGMRVEGENPSLSLAGVVASRGERQARIGTASFGGSAIRFEQRASAGDAAATRSVRVDGLKLALTSLGLRPDGERDRLGLAEASVAADALLLSLPQGELDWSVEGAAGSFSDVRVGGPGGTGEDVRLTRLEFSGAVANLHDRSIRLDKLALDGGELRGWFDPQGELSLAHLFDGFGGPPAQVGNDTGGEAGSAARAAPAPSTAPAAPKASAAPAASPPGASGDEPWRVAVRSIAADGVSVGFEDRRSDPVLAVGLDAIRLRIDGYDSVSKEPLRVEAAAKARDGGNLSAKGSVRAQDGAADLAVEVSELALAPARPFLSRFAELNLASGTFSAQGRLRYRGAADGEMARREDAALVDYRGGFAVSALRLEETGLKRPLLAWDTVSSADVVLSIAPNRLEVGELSVVGADGRLVIGEDRRVNVRGVVKRPEPKAPKPAVAPDATPSADPFPVSVARVRFERGSLDFADLSLRPQFATRMHALKGTIVGLSTDPARVAKLALDARVDDFGSAKIGGQLSLVRPEKSTDVTMNFRNLEMTTLSPYVVRFAGYRIAAGRLSLDLDYKVKDGKLLGTNKIVINKISLGEKVASPGAGDLPLELAIALLQDSDGVIDVDLPVSGDLNDPQFDVGALVSKAIGNLIGGIVTAPFRALGALLGPGSEKTDVVAFEPGSDLISPPDLQKLASVATVLGQRPGLSLVVAGVQAPGLDGPALRSIAVRSAIVRGAGLTLAPGEAPGPIDTSEPRYQRAIEAAFAQRYAPEVLKALRTRAGEKASESGFYDSLLERLIAEAPLDDAALAGLAARRADGVVRELEKAGAPSARVVRAEPRKVEAAKGESVELRLELGVAK